MNLRRFFYWWGPVAVWCSVIFIFSSIPTLPKVEIIWWDFVLKKTAHMLEYGILYFLVFRALSKMEFKIENLKCKMARQNSKLNVYYWLIPFIFGLYYAASDEIHQSFVPGRTCRVRDIGFDFAGMLLVWWWIKSKLKAKSEK